MMEGETIFGGFTLALAILNTCFNFTKFRVKMVPKASYRDGFHVPQDMLEENEYPTNDNVGKYLVREKHFPYNDDLMKKMHNKKSLETLPYKASKRHAYDHLLKVY